MKALIALMIMSDILLAANFVIEIVGGIRVEVS